MAHELDPFVEAEQIDQVLSTVAMPIVRKMVAGIGGVEKVFNNHNRNFYIQEYMAAVTMFQAAERMAEPVNLIHGQDPRRHASIAFRNGMKLPILAAKDLVSSQTFFRVAELGTTFMDTIPGSDEGVAPTASEKTEHLLGYGETGYQMLCGAYEPQVDHWIDELSPRSGYGIHVRQGVGFVAALLSEVQGHYFEMLVDDFAEEAFPDAV